MCNARIMPIKMSFKNKMKYKWYFLTIILSTITPAHLKNNVTTTTPHILQNISLQMFSQNESDLEYISTKPSLINQQNNETICMIGNYHENLKGITATLIDGDFTVTILTTESSCAAEFIVKRINKLELVGKNTTIALRAIQILDISEIIEFVMQEIQFQQKCIEDSLGIFVSTEIWSIIQPFAENQNISFWLLRSSEEILFPYVLHLLYEMPWDQINNVSIGVFASSSQIRNLFLSIAKEENLCFETFPKNNNIFLVIDNDILKLNSFNGTVFAIPTSFNYLNSKLINELPNGSYALIENALDLSELKENSDFDNDFIITSSEYIKFGSALMGISSWLNDSININCPYDFNLSCNNPLIGLHKWNNFNTTLAEILEKLRMKSVVSSMNYNLVQKRAEFNKTQMNETRNIRQVASMNLFTNISTYFHYSSKTLERDIETRNLSHSNIKLGHLFSCHNDSIKMKNDTEYLDYDYHTEMRWQLKSEAWVAAGLTISILGIVMSLCILFFICTRICMDDVLEGNPVSSVLLLVALIFLFASFLPFSIEYAGDMRYVNATDEVHSIWNSLCAFRIFILTLSYCNVFSVLLCRAIMLASIGSEGGFLSHVNGYIQTVICGLSVLVQIGLSTQLLIIMHTTHKNMSCEMIFYGNWLWSLIGYDGCLLASLILLAPFYFRSQRNYHEGILILTGALLTLCVWSTWIPLSMLGHQWRIVAVPLGAQLTGWAVLGGILIPRSFLIVRGIARSDLAQALPSLTTLAFAQANNFISEQSVYECVNPSMRQNNDTNVYIDDSDPETYPLPSEIPTLPLRGASRGNNLHHIQYSQQQFAEQNSNYFKSIQLSPSKITRF